MKRDKVGEIMTAFERVKNILSTYPNSRDSNRKLVAYYWRQELPSLFRKEYGNKAYDVLVALADGKLTEPETITRARRKVQEEYPYLRGEKYEERQEMSRDVRERISSTDGQTSMFDNEPIKRRPSYDN